MSRVSVSFVLLIFFIASVKSQCPTFITRNTWAARAPSAPIPVTTIRPVPYVIVHQTGGAFCSTAAACAEQTRNTQNRQMDVNGYPDIAYNFLVGESNSIYIGRGWVQQGQNVGAFANQAMNIAYIGDFNGRQPNLSTRNLLDPIINCGITAGHLRSDVRVVAACQVLGTSCVTNSIHGWMRDHPRFEENPVPLTT